MEEILKSISEKISSYNIFNNLFPGIIFCSVMTKITRFNFATDTIISLAIIMTAHMLFYIKQTIRK